MGPRMTAKQKTERELNEIIAENLWEPRGDPLDENLEAATEAYLELKRRGLKVKSERDAKSVLTKNNVYERNFLEEDS